MQKKFSIQKAIWCLSILCILSTLFIIIFPNRPIVSVVIPTYNRADLLPRALDSLLKQTFQNFEIVVVNDASTDETAKLLEEYQKKSKKIKVITHKKNQGVSKSRNNGNSKAKGKYITIIDSDDYAMPDFLEKAVSFMEKHPEVTIGVPAKAGYYEKKELGLYDQNLFSWHYPVHNFANYNCLGNVGNIFKRDFIEKHKIKYNTQFSCGEDWDFWVQMALKGATIAKIETREALVAFRAYGGLSMGNCSLADAHIKQKLAEAISYPPEPSNECQVTSAVLKKFPNIFPLDNDRNKIVAECPKETDTYIKAHHKNWNSYLVFSQDASRIHNQINGDMAKVLLFVPYEKITIKWDQYGEETFIYSSTKHAYILEEDENNEEDKK